MVQNFYTSTHLLISYKSSKIVSVPSNLYKCFEIVQTRLILFQACIWKNCRNKAFYLLIPAIYVWIIVFVLYYHERFEKIVAGYLSQKTTIYQYNVDISLLTNVEYTKTWCIMAPNKRVCTCMSEDIIIYQ